LKVSLFIPCLVEQFMPEVGIATAKILSRLGIGLDYPQGQTCCGQPLYKSGYRAKTVELAKQFISLFQDTEAVVCPSGSCVAMVRKEYPSVLKHYPSWYNRALELGPRVHELSQFLVNVIGAVDLGAKWSGSAVFHDSCQALRELGVEEEPRALLSKVKGLTLVPMERQDLCCGFGGAFSLKFPELSEAMVKEKMGYVTATGADWLIGIEPGCLMNMGGYSTKKGLGIQAVHLAQVLASR